MNTKLDVKADAFMAELAARRLTPKYKLAEFIGTYFIDEWYSEKKNDGEYCIQYIYDMQLSEKKKRAIKLGIKSDIMEELTTLLDKYLQEMKESSNP